MEIESTMQLAEGVALPNDARTERKAKRDPEEYCKWKGAGLEEEGS